MTSTELAVPTSTTELTIQPDQSAFTPLQRAALRQLGIEDAPEADITLFFHICQRTQLDPFAEQICMVGRPTKITAYDEKGRKTERWGTKYTIQTRIEGYRVLGHRVASERGDEIEESEPLWCGRDGQWSEVWLDDDNPPAAAKVVIRKNGRPYTGVVKYSEFVQRTKEGNPNSFWKRMPSYMLGKCAEALAWRKAYPRDFAGLAMQDAVHTVIDADLVDTTPTTRPGPRNGIAGLRDQLGVAPAAPDPAPAADPEPSEPREDASDSCAKPDTAQVEAPSEDDDREPRMRRLFAILGGIGVRDTAQRLLLAGRLLDREITDTAPLTGEEIESLITAVTAMSADDARAVIAEANGEKQ